MDKIKQIMPKGIERTKYLEIIKIIGLVNKKEDIVLCNDCQNNCHCDASDDMLNFIKSMKDNYSLFVDIQIEECPDFADNGVKLIEQSIKEYQSYQTEDGAIISAEMVKRMCDVMECVWDCIGADVLNSINKTELSAEDVIEVVLDAGRPITNGRDREAGEILNKLSYNDSTKLAKTVFTYKYYCL